VFDVSLLEGRRIARGDHFRVVGQEHAENPGHAAAADGVTA
jgi:hypothetical protein